MAHTNCIVFSCSHCGKELKGGQKEKMEVEGRIGSALCAECEYFQFIGVVTVDDYHKWLRDEWKIK